MRTIIKEFKRSFRDAFFITEQDCLNKSGKIYLKTNIIIAGIIIFGLIIYNVVGIFN